MFLLANEIEFLCTKGCVICMQYAKVTEVQIFFLADDLKPILKQRFRWFFILLINKYTHCLKSRVMNWINDDYGYWYLIPWNCIIGRIFSIFSQLSWIWAVDVGDWCVMMLCRRFGCAWVGHGCEAGIGIHAWTKHATANPAVGTRSCTWRPRWRLWIPPSSDYTGIDYIHIVLMPARGPIPITSSNCAHKWVWCNFDENMRVIEK